MVWKVNCTRVVTTLLQCVDHQVSIEKRKIGQPLLSINASFSAKNNARKKELVVLLPTRHDLGEI